jgi:hypothetical protein
MAPDEVADSLQELIFPFVLDQMAAVRNGHELGAGDSASNFFRDRQWCAEVSSTLTTSFGCRTSPSCGRALCTAIRSMRFRAISWSSGPVGCAVASFDPRRHPVGMFTRVFWGEEKERAP